MNKTSRLLYKKRFRMAGLYGHLYETKHTSLILFRALYDDDIEEFYIGTNKEGLGEFDDICLRFKVKGFDKPVAVFLQARHAEDEDTALAVTITDLTRCFESYLRIRNEFNVNSSDAIFNGAYEDVECAFVFYTNRRDVINKKYENTKFISKIDDTISTGDEAFQMLIDDEDVKLLHIFLQAEDIKELAAILAKMVRGKHYNHEHLMSEQLVRTYHVILAQHVLHITDVEPEGHRFGYFKLDFLVTNDENLQLLRDSLFSELITNNKPNKNEMPDLLSQLFSEPSEDTISKLIGGVIAYENNKLKFVHKELFTDDKLRRQLKQVNVTEAVVKRAIDTKAREILYTSTLKLPPEFGNKDLTIRGSEKKKERRLHHLSVKIIELLVKSEEKFVNNQKFNILEVDDSVIEKGFVQINGGLAGAVGNLLVMDENTKLLMFANSDDLKHHPLASRLLDEISSKTEDLHKYRFVVKSKYFPKLSFDCNEHDKRLVDDFMNKLLFYTNQASESEVEKILKNEIAQRLKIKEQLRVDAIYLKYYDNIVKWSMNERMASYLTKQSSFFETTTGIIWTPILTITNISNKYRFVKSDIKFKTDVVNSLKFDESSSSVTVIISEVIDFSVIKVTQHFKDDDYMLIDTNYIFNLSAHDYGQLIDEMTSIVNKIFILIWNSRPRASGTQRKIQDLFERMNGKKLIIVTSDEIVDEIKTYLVHTEIDVIIDDNSSLADLTITSQEAILYSDVTFQGKEVDFFMLIDDHSKVLIKGKHLNKLINGETIQIGAPLTNPTYEAMKEFYIDRQVTKKLPDEPPINTRSASVIDVPTTSQRMVSLGRTDRTVPLKTLYDMDEHAVLITAEPGMGKSTLLTHLSLTTKAYYPGVWVVRIDLLDYSWFFHQWTESKVVIDILEALRFICIDVINQIEAGFMSSEKIILKEKEGWICLDDCPGLNEDNIFELNMFLHFCNRRKVIFLFDGFDEICPDYKMEVIAFIKVLKSYRPGGAHRVWVTSRTYNDVVASLEQVFGYSYQLNAFNLAERFEMFTKSFHSRGKNFNDNISSEFIKLIEQHREQIESDNLNRLLYKQTGVAVDWTKVLLSLFKWGPPFQKPKITDRDKGAYSAKSDRETSSVRASLAPSTSRRVRQKAFHEEVAQSVWTNKLFSTPLHQCIMAEYFKNKIKSAEEPPISDLAITTHAINEFFVETILKKIFIVNKSKMDMNMLGVKRIYKRTRQQLVDKYKKLAAYATFKNYVDQLFNEVEIKYIKDTIESIKLGEDKSGIICDITDDVPRFVDDFLFREYFAVEYICDLLKTDHSDLELTALWAFILNTMFFEIKMRFFLIFDEKLKLDKTLGEVISDERNKRIILDLLMKQYSKSALLVAMHRELSHWMILFLSTFELIDTNNLRDFIQFVVRSKLLKEAVNTDNKELIHVILKTVNNVDKSQLHTLFVKVGRRLRKNRRNFEIISALVLAYFDLDPDSGLAYPRSDSDSHTDSDSE